MPQVFNRQSNFIARGSLIGLVVFLGLFVLAAWIYVRSPWVTFVGVPREQPIAFSHKHHVLDDGIDCRYCHTSVETSSFAGLPDTKTCMNCHSQIFANASFMQPIRTSWTTGQSIQWTRVNSLPDYVYFDHSIHINKGIGCSSCHGAVDQEPLMTKAQTLQMGFCIDCHMHPEQNVRPLDQVFNVEYQKPANQAQLGAQLVKEYNIKPPSEIMSCSVCHR